MIQQGTIAHVPVFEYLHGQPTITFDIHPDEYPKSTWTLRYSGHDAQTSVLQLKVGTIIQYSRQLPSPQQQPFPINTLEVTSNSAMAHST